MANNIVQKGYARLGLQAFLMVVGVLIALLGLLSTFLISVPFIGSIFAANAKILWAIELVIVVVLGVL